jgi:hypothetical protein
MIHWNLAVLMMIKDLKNETVTKYNHMQKTGVNV